MPFRRLLSKRARQGERKKKGNLLRSSSNCLFIRIRDNPFLISGCDGMKTNWRCSQGRIPSNGIIISILRSMNRHPSMEFMSKSLVFYCSFPRRSRWTANWFHFESNSSRELPRQSPPLSSINNLTSLSFHRAITLVPRKEITTGKI